MHQIEIGSKNIRFIRKVFNIVELYLPVPSFPYLAKRVSSMEHRNMSIFPIHTITAVIFLFGMFSNMLIRIIVVLGYPHRKSDY